MGNNSKKYQKGGEPTGLRDGTLLGQILAEQNNDNVKKLKLKSSVNKLYKKSINSTKKS